MKTFVTIIALVVALMCGCATQGGQNLDPIWQVLYPKLKVLDFDAKTYVDAAAHCNAEAAKDYNAAMVICSNPQNFINQINSIGGQFIPANLVAPAVQAITAKCTIDGFLPTLAPTIQQTTCPAGTSSSSLVLP